MSDGLFSPALEYVVSLGRPLRRFPLVGGLTVWDDPPEGKVILAVACPNRLGVFEPLPGRAWWDKLWWWPDPLSPDPPGYRLAPRVEKQNRAPVRVAAQGSGDRDLRAEACERSLRAADYLIRRLRNLRGVRVPTVSHGRRFPLLLPVNPTPALTRVAEELRVPRPVDGWPGLVICEVGWWQSTKRLDSLVDIVRQAVQGERPAALEDAEREWSSPPP